jgi:hypothetical protein
LSIGVAHERRSTSRFRGADWLGHSHNSWNQLLADDGDGFHEIAVIPLGQFFRLSTASHNTMLATGLVIAPFVMSSSISRMRIAVLAMARQSDVLPSSMGNSSSVPDAPFAAKVYAANSMLQCRNNARRGLTVGAPYPIFPAQSPSGGMVDATDSKSVIRKGVLVRVRPGAPFPIFAKHR